ncbi:MAG: hypothetical protein ABI591_26150 [Kofleriaceae bacterium]
MDMRIILVLTLLTTLGCTQHNPDSCCTTMDQCQQLGLSGVVACETGKACTPAGNCIAAECNTSPDCTSTAAPICEDQLCVATCSSDAECVGVQAGPYCSAGACVACVMSSQCTPETPVCDSTSLACRGCAQDSECDSGVCLEDIGTCADPSRLIFVTQFMTDAGECTSSSPCGTLGYALTKMTTARDVIHINSASLPPAPVALDNHTGRIDGSNTLLTRADAGNVLSMAAGQMTLTGLRIGNSIGTIVPLSVSAGHVVAYGVDFLGIVKTSGGTVEIRASNLEHGVTCDTAGQLILDRSIVQFTVMTNNCEVEIARSRFEDGSNISTIASSVHIANNLILSSSPFTDPVSLGAVTGSYFMFNTMVNTGPLNTASALQCDATVDARDNIVAWNSSNAPACASQYSLFDSSSVTPAGQGNKSGDVATFFVDLPNGDLHLPSSSPARAAGIATSITTDYDGLPRANPPDIGAYQVH